LWRWLVARNDLTVGQYDGRRAVHANRLAEGKLPLCAEMCSTKALLAGDDRIIAEIYKERVMKRGYLVLPSGIHGDVLGLTPPLMLSEPQRDAAFQALAQAIEEEQT